MPGLLEQQRAMRAFLLAGDSAAPPPHAIGGIIGDAARFGIYRNNVFVNLTGALRLTYPAVGRLVGPAFFAAAAERFIRSAPPATADLHEYGEGFAAFLEDWQPARSLSYLADVARLEWTVSRALHAKLTPALAPETLARLPLEQRADIRLVPHPSLALLALAHPARAIWDAVLTGDEGERSARLAAIDLTAGGEHLAVLHARGEVEVLPLSSAGFGFAQALARGLRLAAALDAVAQEDAVPLLGTFLAHGFFCGVRLPDGATVEQEE